MPKTRPSYKQSTRAQMKHTNENKENNIPHPHNNSQKEESQHKNAERNTCARARKKRPQQTQNIQSVIGAKTNQVSSSSPRLTTLQNQEAQNTPHSLII